jgi:hypothetical protein
MRPNRWMFLHRKLLQKRDRISGSWRRSPTLDTLSFEHQEEWLALQLEMNRVRTYCGHGPSLVVDCRFCADCGKNLKP